MASGSFIGCCEHGDFDGARRQLEQGVDPKSCADSNGWTALHYAAFYGNVDFVKELIEDYSCSTEAKSTIWVGKDNEWIWNGSTPLHLACL